MRDANGVYLGHSQCAHWKGVDRYGEAECCGGRKYPISYVKCAVKGVVPCGKCVRAGCADVKEGEQGV